LGDSKTGQKKQVKMKDEITFDDFLKVDIRVGTIIEVNDFPKARKPAYQLSIDFGSLGIKKSSAQITDLYTKEDLLQKQVSAITNFKPRQIANFKSEVLVLGVYTDDDKVVLLKPSKTIKNGEQVS
jgi:tRNA-binding protein